MTRVATFVSNPQQAVLNDALLARMLRELQGGTAARWLDRGVAADISFDGAEDRDDRALAEHLRAALGDAPVDVVVQPIAHRRKRLFLADMDSTMIGQECIDELADKLGLKAQVAAITERAMRGELEFAPALRERVALLKGLPVSAIDDIIAERITLTPGAQALVRTMRANGVHTCLVTGGFTLFSDRIAGMIGFHEMRANRLLVDNDRLAGEVGEPIFGREAKLAALLELRARLSLTPRDTMAVGDGANDLAMIEEAGLGVAYHAKPAVAAAAAARIHYGDLTALLYLQGYRREDFVEA